MGAKITFDATNRKFVVTEPPNAQGVISIDLQVDLYSDAKEDWQDAATYPDLAKMQFPVEAIGGNPFGAKTLGISYLIKHGWSFKPYEADHTMVIIGNVGTQAGWELVDDTVGSYRVRVESDVSSIVSLENLSFMEGATYGGKVIVDPDVHGQAGTAFPIGTYSAPSNNLADALAIAGTRGLNTFEFVHSATLGADAILAGYILQGASPVTVTLTVLGSASIQGCEFRNMALTGVLDGQNIVRNSFVYDVTDFNGYMHECSISGDIGVGGGQANFFSCYSNVAGGGAGQYANIDFGNNDVQVAVRGYSGGLGIVNSVGTQGSSYDFESGRIIFESSCAGGEHTVRGIADVINNSGAGTAVYDLTTTADVRRARKLVSNRQELVDTGTDVRIRTWDDDGATVLEENILLDPNNNEPDLVAGSVTKRGVSQ